MYSLMSSLRLSTPKNVLKLVLQDIYKKQVRPTERVSWTYMWSKAGLLVYWLVDITVGGNWVPLVLPTKISWYPYLRIQEYQSPVSAIILPTILKRSMRSKSTTTTRSARRAIISANWVKIACMNAKHDKERTTSKLSPQVCQYRKK